VHGVDFADVLEREPETAPIIVNVGGAKVVPDGTLVKRLDLIERNRTRRVAVMQSLLESRLQPAEAGTPTNAGRPRIVIRA
jgi:hypothetical protein